MLAYVIADAMCAGEPSRAEDFIKIRNVDRSLRVVIMKFLRVSQF